MDHGAQIAQARLPEADAGQTARAHQRDDAPPHRHPHVPLARDHSREEDGDDAVGADDVAGEDDAVHEPEEDHPPSAAAHQARRIVGGLLADEGLPLRGHVGRPRRAHLRIHRLVGGLDIALDAAPHHRRDAETEEEGEKRVPPPVDQRGADEEPPAVRGGGAIGGGGEVPQPVGDVRERDEQQHEAARDIGRGVAHGAPAGEGQGGHG